ncbi:MAG: DUF2085 domain-containing protein [Thermoplasmata archaeon]|nr:DUF2085 domain-containing protein [Thermoplasmata archaeon]
MPPNASQPPPPPPPPPQPSPPPSSATFVHERWQWGLEPRPKILYINLVALIIVGIWTGLMYATPYMVEEGSLLGLDGWVGVKDHEEIWEDLPPIVSTMYSAGDSQCHQKQNRSLILNGNQMPFCARDVAIYTFMTIGLAISVFPRMPHYDRINNLKAWWLMVALVPIGIDGVGQLLGYWESTNLMRFITGGLCGLIVGIALGFMLREMGGMVREFRTERKMYKMAEEADLASQRKEP